MSLALTKLRQKLTELKLDGFLVTKVINVQYLSGFTGESTWLLITQDNNYLITDFRYIEQAQQETKGWKIIQQTKGMVKKLKELSLRLKSKKMGFESVHTSYNTVKTLSKELNRTRLIPTSGIVETLRTIKTPEEIKLMRKAIDCAAEAFAKTSKFIKHGLTEKDVAHQLEYYLRQAGAEGSSFSPIIAFDERAALPHASPTDKRLKPGGAVLIDWGASYQSYNSDNTRMIFIDGMPKQIKKIYDIVQEAQNRAIAQVKPGVMIGRIDRAARDFIKQHGYGKNFGHGLGHGIGREVHEAPGVGGKNKARLEAGMIFTVEPGIYLAGKAGVRIEDMVLVTEQGHEVITRGIPKLLL